MVPLSFLFSLLSHVPMYTTPSPDNSFDKYDEMRLHMEQLLSSSLIEFDIPMRIALSLDDVGIRRLKDLVKLKREDLFRINRLGEKGVNEIERILDRFGLSLGMKV